MTRLRRNDTGNTVRSSPCTTGSTQLYGMHAVASKHMAQNDGHHAIIII
jgi:hypothetical protein